MAEREDPLVAFKFALEIEGKLSGYFMNVSGIGSETEVIEQKITNPETGETLIHKIPGRHSWTEVSLRRGVTSNLDVWEWRKAVVQGKIEDARTNCSIVALAQDNKEVARWNLEQAWPTKVTGPEMDAAGADYMVEEITIVHEGVERVS
ncbi:MAG: phage tail protein [Chloroflexi bacterium]|jgi:phage tail-like protein|nr:phage tail protein [Anaerolineaceae bacterium]NMB88204.1 phage tail protein [Chloroflexota bacterium]